MPPGGGEKAGGGGLGKGGGDGPGGNGEGNAGNSDQPLDPHTTKLPQGYKHITVTPVDLYAFGNATKTARIRLGDDFTTISDWKQKLAPQDVLAPEGSSSFADVSQSGLTGPYHRLPKGTQLPPGVAVIADGKDVYPGSKHPKTHYTFYNTSDNMTAEDFENLRANLGWIYENGKVPKKPKVK